MRKITDKLDAVGNAAAIGKGFAIGSAALTAIILFSAFKETAGITSIELTAPKVLVGVYSWELDSLSVFFAGHDGCGPSCFCHD